MPASASPHLGSASQSYALAVLEYMERLGMDPVDILARTGSTPFDSQGRARA